MGSSLTAWGEENPSSPGSVFSLLDFPILEILPRDIIARIKVELQKCVDLTMEKASSNALETTLTLFGMGHPLQAAQL